MKTENSILKSLLTIFILLPISIIFNGFIVKFLWNGLVTPIFNFNTLTIIQAIGLDVFVTYIIAGNQSSTLKSTSEVIVKILSINLSFLLIGWIVMMFM